MKANRDDTDAGEHNRYVFVDVPRCPLCNSKVLKTYKSVTTGEGDDESVTRYTRCGECEHKFFVILQ